MVAGIKMILVLFVFGGAEQNRTIQLTVLQDLTQV